MKISKKTTIENLAAIICEHLSKKGLDVVLVGGAVVSIYSENEYQSKDLDFISPNEHADLVKAVGELGFQKRGRDLIHERSQYSIEFPTGPLAIGNEIPVKVDHEISTKHGKIKILSPTQCVMDRLTWFYHYNDRQCLDQALAVALRHPIKLERIKTWSKSESAVEKFEVFIERLNRQRKQNS